WTIFLISCGSFSFDVLSPSLQAATIKISNNPITANNPFFIFCSTPFSSNLLNLNIFYHVKRKIFYIVTISTRQIIILKYALFVHMYKINYEKYILKTIINKQYIISE